jgi:hypothetical protein
MCTLSLATSADGGALRLLMNRDERRLRPVARPPAIQTRAGASVVWPEDPLSGGTWIAATDAGLALALLNVDAQRRTDDRLSRGLVIPALADARSLEDVETRLGRLDPAAFAAFRLVAIMRDQILVYASLDRTMVRGRVGRARLLASSSLGDALVEPMRAQLFATLLGREADPWLAQTRLHQHAWPDRRHLSVMMTRSDACTVSQTEIVLAPDRVMLTYRPVVDGWPLAPTQRHLTLSLARAA